MEDSKKGSSSSSRRSDGKSTTTKPNPLGALLQHGSFQALHKLLNNTGSFCDPFRPEEEEESDNDTRRSGAFQELTEEERERFTEQINAKVTIITSADVVEGQGWSNVVSVSPDNSSSSGSPKPEMWRSIFRSEGLNNAAATVIAATLPEDVNVVITSSSSGSTLPETMMIAPSETFENEFELQLPSDSSDEYNFLSLAQSESTEAGDMIQLSEAHTPKGAPQSPKDFSASSELMMVTTTPRSSTWQIVKFFLLWTVAFAAALFLHPDTGYDSDWLVEKYELAQVTLQTQAEECQNYIQGGGSRGGTSCALEKLHDIAQAEITKCQAYYANGETNTRCFTEVSAQALLKQGARLTTALQETVESIQDVCTWENAQTVFSQQQEWAVQMIGQIQDQLTTEYAACDDFFMNDKKGTGCPLENVYNQWKQQQEWTMAQLQQLQDRVYQEYDVCQTYWMDGERDTGCSLERAQMEWNRQTQKAMDTFEETKALLLDHQAKCQSYWTGETGTHCLLEHVQIQWVEQREWMSSTAAELKVRLEEASTFQEFLVIFKGIYTEQLQQQHLNHEVVTQGSGDTEPEIDQTGPLQNATDNEESPREEEISDDYQLIQEAVGRETTTVSDEGSQPADDSGSEAATERPSPKEDRRKHAESYFDKLDPIPAEKLVQRSPQVITTDELIDTEKEEEANTEVGDTAIKESPVSEEKWAESLEHEKNLTPEEAIGRTGEEADTADEDESLGEGPGPSVDHENDEETPIAESIESNKEIQDGSIEGTPVATDAVSRDIDGPIPADEKDDIWFVKLEYDNNGTPYMVRVGKKWEAEETKETNADVPRATNKWKSTSYGYFFGGK